MSPSELPNNAIKANILQEEHPLTPEEKQILSKIRYKKLIYIGSTYAVLTGALIFTWIRKWLASEDYNEDDAMRFKVVVPYVMLFFFTVLTIYFISYYLKSVHPFVKDLKRGSKILIYFDAEVYKTPFFDAYYLKTPSRKNAMIRISKEIYDSIHPGSRGQICLSPYARFVFSVEVAANKIYFNEKYAMIYD